MTAPQPTLAGFQWFITNVMDIKPADLPPTSQVIPWSLAVALAIVNPALHAICIPQFDAAQVQLNSGGFSIYSQAVYNLAGDRLVNYAQDQPGRGFFKKLRKQLNITGFVSGVVSGAADETSSVSILVQEAAKKFTLKDIQNLKTIWGRQYLELAQSYGDATWGMS